MTDPQDHAASIRAATAALYRKLDAEKRPRAIGKHLEAINNAAAALQQQRDYHRDDAAAVRRERDAEINRLAGELAQVRARAAEQEHRAARGLAEQYETGITTAEELLAEHGIGDLTDTGEDAS